RVTCVDRTQLPDSRGLVSASARAGTRVAKEHVSRNAGTAIENVQRAARQAPCEARMGSSSSHSVPAVRCSHFGTRFSDVCQGWPAVTATSRRLFFYARRYALHAGNLDPQKSRGRTKLIAPADRVLLASGSWIVCAIVACSDLKAGS